MKPLQNRLGATIVRAAAFALPTSTAAPATNGPSPMPRWSPVASAGTASFRDAIRRLAVIVALGALLGVSGVGTAGPALARGRGPQWELQPAEPFTLPADYCGFPIGFSWPVRKEYSKILKAADGSMIILTTGVDKIVATNLSTGKTGSTGNISGPAKVTTFPDGSVTVSAKGRSGFVFSPADAERFGMPTIGVTAGAQTTTFDANGDVTSFSLQGHVAVEDTCAALS